MWRGLPTFSYICLCIQVCTDVDVRYVLRFARYTQIDNWNNHVQDDDKDDDDNFRDSNVAA